jgi:hypothetical protein
VVPADLNDEAVMCDRRGGGEFRPAAELARANCCHEGSVDTDNVFRIGAKGRRSNVRDARPMAREWVVKVGGTSPSVAGT